ncbi:MAG: DciA family protein [Pseudomonadota bacterium]
MVETRGNGKSEGKLAGASRRRGRGFHRASATAKARLGAAAAKKGFAEPDVLLRWAEAVGTHLAGLCQPVKVSYGGAIGATLTVKVDGGHAPEVAHQAPKIIERINSFYGYRAISRLKLTQATGMAGRAHGFAEDAARFEGPPPSRRGAQFAREPDPAAVRKAKNLTSEIRDPDLRDALSRMSAWVLSKPTSDRRT